ncbi:Hypothetical protein DHA2_151242 [Giardia duodenalis]|uniref:RIIa domain-containing protein n=1 Tax=Giardia intestinalis TaxID=5741 RepID=V6TMV8_GIAIN|nr:Hypothetical protein DHA2_151242 [Giardia intestinalis]
MADDMVTASGASSGDDHASNLNEEQLDASEEQPLGPETLVYEEPDDVAADEEGTLRHESINDLEAHSSSEKLGDVEHVSEHTSPKEVNGKDDLEEEDETSILAAEILEDDPIVYAPEDIMDEEDDRPPESPAALPEEQRVLASAGDYQNVDALLTRQVYDPLEHLEVGGLDDVDPLRASVDPGCTPEDHLEAEELVIINVDLDMAQQEDTKGSAEPEASPVVLAKAPDQHLPSINSLQASGSKPHKDSFDEGTARKHIVDQTVDAGEEPVDPSMHPAIAQAIKTRNDHFPLLSDPKLPHTRENFNLPPLVEGHSVPVDKGTYKDYVFDLERQEYLQKEEVTKAHTEYLERHHELKQIVSDFLTSILIDKPTDVYQYAADYFSVVVN